MYFLFNPDVFVLGLAVGVLGLIVLLSVLVSFAYDERTLQFLAGYICMMVVVLLLGELLQTNTSLIKRLLLVAGPVLVGAMQMWLFRKRTAATLDVVVTCIVIAAALGLLGFFVAGSAGLLGRANTPTLTLWLCLGWGALMFANLTYRGVQALDTAGPWKWWLMLGHGAGLGVALLFLTNVIEASRSYWPVVLMVLWQAPPIYLALVWRSRLLNEIRLRSAAANVTDPLTGLATTPVLIERIMRIMSRSQHNKNAPASSALFLIEVQNWHGLISELGPDFNEKLLLETALRLRRSVGDNDLVARIRQGRFAVVAQGLASDHEITNLATRLVVSGLRIDSPLLPGVELKLRVIVTSLKVAESLTLPATKAWLDSLADRFQAWPSTHRSRSILVVADETGKAGRTEAASSY